MRHFIGVSRIRFAPDTRGVCCFRRHRTRLNNRTRTIGRCPPSGHARRGPTSLNYFYYLFKKFLPNTKTVLLRLLLVVSRKRTKHLHCFFSYLLPVSFLICSLFLFLVFLAAISSFFIKNKSLAFEGLMCVGSLASDLSLSSVYASTFVQTSLTFLHILSLSLSLCCYRLQVPQRHLFYFLIFFSYKYLLKKYKKQIYSLFHCKSCGTFLLQMS